jgi:hypothetical protein
MYLCQALHLQLSFILFRELDNLSYINIFQMTENSFLSITCEQSCDQDNEVLLQIDKDVRRLCPDISFFSQVATDTVYEIYA